MNDKHPNDEKSSKTKVFEWMLAIFISFLTAVACHTAYDSLNIFSQSNPLSIALSNALAVLSVIFGWYVGYSFYLIKQKIYG